MESNIKGLVAAGHEMASELKAECGAVDMRSVAKLISDLATQLEVQLVRANALAEDHQRATESIKQADSAVKLAREKFSALAAENAALKQSEKEFNNFCRQEYYGWEDNFTETPATDAFLAEVRAQGVEMLTADRKSEWMDSYIDDANYGGFILHGTITKTVTITTVVMMPAEPKTYKRKSTQFKPLTAMQEAYCQSYIKTPENQTQAAINAGFSPNTAAVKASVMMRDERIQKRIAELMEERNKRMRVSADYVLMRLVEIDQMDVIDILNDDGSLKPIREWPKIWRTTLSGFDLSSTIMNMNEDSIETILKKIKWPDKVKNLELIGKHVDVNAFKERLDVNVNVTIADRIAAARKRLKERQDGNQ